MNYEYGIMMRRSEHLHRSNMTREEALEFVREAVADGFPTGFFWVVRRPLGDWEFLHGGPLREQPKED